MRNKQFFLSSYHHHFESRHVISQLLVYPDLAYGHPGLEHAPTSTAFLHSVLAPIHDGDACRLLHKILLPSYLRMNALHIGEKLLASQQLGKESPD